MSGKTLNLSGFDEEVKKEVDLSGFDRETGSSDAPAEKGFLAKAAEVAAPILDKIDSYTGAPLRASQAKAIEIGFNSGKSNSEVLSEVGGAFKDAWGGDTSKVPTNKENAIAAGLSDVPMSEHFPSLYTDEPGLTLKAKKGGFLDASPAGAAGLVGDVGNDLSNLVPVGKIAKGIGGALKDSRIAGGIGRVAEAFTGVPRKETQTYIQHLDDVGKIGAEFGDDTYGASNSTRAQFKSDIDGARKGLNETITTTLSKSHPGKTIDVSGVVAELEAHKARLNPKFNADDIAEIDELISFVKTATDNGTAVNLVDGHGLKEWLQKEAKPSYKNGAIFQRGDKAQQAARAGARKTKELVNSAAPEIADANEKLSMMHSMEDRMNANLVTPNTPDASLMSAGSGSNKKNITDLKDLGELTDSNMIGEAEKLAAYKRFNSPELLPVDTTGKSFTRMAAARMALGAGGAYAAGENPLLGLAATSPAALKATIHGSRAIGRVAASPLTRATYLAAQANNRHSHERVMRKVQGTEFEAPIAAAQQRGEDASASTFYTLYNNEEKFRSLIDDEDELD